MSEQPDAAMAASLDVTEHAAQVVAAYVSRNSPPASELPALIGSVHQAITALQNGTAAPAPAVAPEPAVPIKKSVLRDFIVCLDDGKKFTSLRRHLSVLGMTPDAYRAKWGLPADYPMTAAAYSEKRSALAKSAGLGQQRVAARAIGAELAKKESAMEPKLRGRARKAA